MPLDSSHDGSLPRRRCRVRLPSPHYRRALRCVAIILACCLGFAASTCDAAPAPRAGAAILVSHRFGPKAASTTASDAALDIQLGWLAKNVRVAPLRDVIAALRAGDAAAWRACVAITADMCGRPHRSGPFTEGTNLGLGLALLMDFAVPV